MARVKQESNKELVDLLSRIDIHSTIAVYEQVENLVLFAVSAGHIKSGDRLPPVRELADHLKVNINTIAKSYRDLEVMGVVYTRRGMGIFINKGVEARCREHCRHHFIARLFQVVAEGKAAGISESDIKNLLARCQTANADPYGPAPTSLFQEKKS